MIYHSITKSDWESAKTSGIYSPESIQKDGYIHCSSLDQLVPITNLVFEKRDDVLILGIDEKMVLSKVLLEDTKGHGRFSHIYGPLNLNAVIKTYSMHIDENPKSRVSFKLPPELRQETIQLNETTN